MSRGDDAHTCWSRRTVLEAGLGLAAALSLIPSRELLAAAAAASDGGGWKFLTDAEAADVEAISAQIIPSDETPGAREIGVTRFIDRALGSCLAPLAAGFRAGLGEFASACRARHPGSTGFAALAAAQKIEWLRSVETTPFFGLLQQLTVLGALTMPAYGGNRDGLGWQLIGFEDRHAFTPPFGDYDRDYPGFAPVAQDGR